MNNLFSDDFADLDQLMSQFNRQGAPRASGSIPADQVSRPFVAPTSGLSLPSPTLGSGAAPRGGRRATVVASTPDPPPPLAAPHIDFPRDDPHDFAPIPTAKPQGAVSWLDEDFLAPAPAVSQPVAAATTTTTVAPTVGAALPSTAQLSAEESDAMPWETPRPKQQAAVSDKPIIGKQTQEPSQPSPRPPSPNSVQNELRREEMALLAEIAALERETELAEAAVGSAEVRHEAELLELQTKVLLQEKALEQAVTEGQQRRKDALKYSQQAVEKLQEKKESELGHLSTAHRRQHAAYFDRTLASLRESIRIAEAGILKLSNERDFLLTGENGQHTSYSPEAISVGVASISSGSTADKLQYGATMVKGFVSRQLNIIRERIVGMIRHETVQASQSAWEGHRAAFSDDSDRRRRLFVSFLQDSVGHFTEFVHQRQLKREADVATFRRSAAALGASIRARGHERSEARRKEILALHEEQCAAFEQELRTSVQYLAEKSSVMFESDQRIAEQQVHEANHRHSVEAKVQKTLFVTEAETLAAHLNAVRKHVEQWDISDCDPFQATVKATKSVGVLKKTISQFRESVDDAIELQRKWSLALSLDECNSNVYSPEEQKVRMLLQEKQSVTEDLSKEVRRQWETLTEMRMRCGDLRAQLSLMLEDVVAIICEGRLMQQCSQSKVELLRGGWESEHRAMLSRPLVVADGSGGDAKGGGKEDVNFDPKLDTLLRIGGMLTQRASGLRERSSANRKAVSLQRAVQEREDTARDTTADGLQSAWTSLYGRLLSMHEYIQRITSQQVECRVEEAKLGIESEAHESQRTEFLRKAEILQHEAAKIEAASAQAMKTKQRLADETARLSVEHDRLNREHTALVSLQSELIQRQFEQHANVVDTIRATQQQQQHTTTRKAALPPRVRTSPFADIIAAHVK